MTEEQRFEHIETEEQLKAAIGPWPITGLASDSEVALPEPPPAMRYKVIAVTDDFDQFASLVNDHLARGWELQGGVSVSVWFRPAEGAYYESATHEQYAQAMVKPGPALRRRRFKAVKP